ncbi:putative copper resistance protein D [Sediminihabitans luteus]|uniref:Putative copper resistance protein D n=1 Tax=Sediminihabitans luteus TaxID=1138585 RepID=A0A2M9D0Q0_9CELL|nr:cytochrome c oxidase assembly protein [Sediminihabitans luteus]PJJ77730.1 putative copper resistance protein D [Sediminihabitans luteus]GIJ00043.1 ABC transporter permease [Sediminihabitans luteus]
MTSTASRPSATSTTSGARTRDPLVAPGTPWWLVAAGPGAVLVAVLAVLAAGAFSGALEATFVDPGTFARIGLPISTVLTELAASVTIGSLALGAFVLAPGRPLARALATAGVAAATWAVLTVVQLVLRYSSISGTPVTASSFGDQLGQFVTQIALGQTYLAIIVVAATTSAVALAIRTPNGALVTGLLALVAIGVQASTGHASGAANHEIAISSMFLHLAGAALWIGGLGGLAVSRVRGAIGRKQFTDAVSRYSGIALWCYVAVGVSGVANALIRVENLADLGTRYGELLIVKAVLLVVLGTFGFVHRESVIRRMRGLGSLAKAERSGVEKVTTRLFWRLVSVELLVMGAVSGVAVALGSTAPPIPDDPFVDPTPAEVVTGHELPPEPSAAGWAFGVQIDLLWAFVCVAGIVVYLRWVRRLRRRGDAWPWQRAVFWCAGMLVLLWTTNGGAAVYGHVLFSGHMIQHMTLAMIVPIFLVLSAPVTLLLRANAARRDGSKGPREWTLGLVNSKFGHFVAHPVVAGVNFAGSMIVFYYTPAFEYALTTYVGHVLMITHFTLAGYLFVNALIGIDPGPARLGYPQRLLLLLATMAFHAFFGVTLMMSNELLVADWFGLMGRPWGPSAIADQQKGGGIAWSIGEIPTLALALVVALSWSRSDEREARRRDRRVDRDGDVEMDQYNEMLAQLKERDDRVEHPDR